MLTKTQADVRGYVSRNVYKGIRKLVGGAAAKQRQMALDALNDLEKEKAAKAAKAAKAEK
jgi:hypothetical protein